MTRKQVKKGGAILPLNPTNFTAQPDIFPSSFGKINGVGCAGTKSNVKAADGKFVPYKHQIGGTPVFCTSDNPLISGPKMGYSSVNACPASKTTRSLEIPGKFPSSLTKGGRKRRTRKRRKSAKRRKKTRSSKRGTKSKTHRGKNYETRKSSKRYRTGKFKKFLRGRKTMLAPDFSFAGGGPTGRSSVMPVGTPVPSTTVPSLQQPYSNIPYTPGYSTGGTLPNNMSSLANPVPYSSYNHCPSA
jgi:hypothetical protein|tara:strand:- start:688 stop:1419 length:732 start_codon:yes stop_codon:yes gene_type:complete